MTYELPELPEHEDLEFQQEMLRQLRQSLEIIDDSGNVVGNTINELERAMRIVDLLQQYSGY